jgi:hypothetical protein
VPKCEKKKRKNRGIFLKSSVADPGCLSRISDPGFKTSTKERGEKKVVVIPFFGATNFTKLKVILI